MQSILATANQAFQKGETAAAMAGYVSALLKMPELGKTIAANMARTKKHYLNTRSADKPLKAVVCGWELAHNAAGRAHTLAEIYREITSDVQIIGSIFPRWGRDVWEPIRNTEIPIHSFIVEQPDQFIEQAMALVAAYPANVVHLSKPRAPNIFFGIFYKLLWGAKVIIDIDEEELVFVKADTPLTVDEYLKDYPELPPLDLLTDNHWTRIAVGLAGEFDAITVSNAALQRRYGGTVIGHARDPRVLKPSPELRQKNRAALGIQPHQKVVLFSGTPRPHKGLLEVAQAIKALKRDDIIFIVAGSFGEKHMAFKDKLEAVTGVNYLFLENQPMSALASTLAVADCCVLLQDTNHPSSKYQIPAKLSDALAMRVPVITSVTDALSDVISACAVIVAEESSLEFKINETIDEMSERLLDAGSCYFNENICILTNSVKLHELVDGLAEFKTFGKYVKFLKSVCDKDYKRIEENLCGLMN